MFESLLIQNFQTHEKTRVDFSPGITTIVGPSDVGKSAIIRALRWVCENQPGGDAFVRHGAKGATVRLVADGHTVTRRRSPGGEVNEYALDERQFKAFNRGVPEPIAHHLNLGPVCWQGQHDAPYWFAETAGEVSRQLNSIVNLGIIDDVLAKVTSARTHARTRLDVAEENLTATKYTYDELAWAPKFCNALDIVEDAEDAALATTTKATAARALYAEAILARTTRDNAARVAQTGQKAVVTGAFVLQERAVLGVLAELRLRHDTLVKAAGVPVPDTATLDTAYAEWKHRVKIHMDLEGLLFETRRIEAILCAAEKELNEAMKALPVACPTCGRSS